MIKDQEYDYFYEEGDRKYCYPNSNVLINKLNIRDPDILWNAERELTEQRYYALIKMGVTGDFSLKNVAAHSRDFSRELAATSFIFSLHMV
uniref:hypothetical protein n=1 Tax=Eubacterium cellulosolvens TaxID=29322 RepID=UPI000685E908|nr:hypothetical protein [[Eubacterium] cellulosolvens]